MSYIAKPPFATLFRSPALLLASGFGSGRSPVAPGTAGSLLALPLAWPLLNYLNPFALMAVLLLTLVIGAWSSGVAGKAWGKVDHGAIVIDEVLGQWITLVIAVALVGDIAPTLWLYGLGFLLFRVFDITKPWPANWFDRHSKNGWGVMLDDVAAGVWAGLILTVLLTLIALQ